MHSSAAPPRPRRIAETTHDWDHPRSIGGTALLVRFAAAHGVPAAACLEGTGVDPEALQGGVALVEARQEIEVVRNVLAALDRPGLGAEVGADYHLTTFGIYGYALLASATVAEVTRVALAYAELSFAFTAIRSEVTEAGEARLVYSADRVPGDLRRFVTERDMAASVAMQREILADPVLAALREVRFTFPAVDTGVLDAVFGAPVRFGCERNELVYDAAFLDRPVPQADPLTAHECLALCDQVLSRRRAGRGMAARVRERLLEGDLQRGMEAVARELAIAPRTLRRQLAQEGTSYRALADEVRQLLVVELVEQQGLPTADVAERLGYQDQSSFRRALRRWRSAS